MARSKQSKGSKAAVWTILVLLIVGLGGFGVTNFSGTINSIGRVGDRDIGVQRYARELQGQMRAFSAQTGQNMTFAQAQAFGLDRAVLQRLVSTVAIEDEAARLGLSAGDEEVRKQILAIPAFQGLDGAFDREAYRFTLEQSGQNEAQFEENLRAEIARTLVQGAVADGVAAPGTFVDAVLNFEAETRDFSWARLGPEALEDEIAEPSDADIRAWYEANEAAFMLPETKRITYAWLTPDMLVDTVEIDEAALRQLYQDRIDDFVKPERRLVERLVLGDRAQAARDRLDAGELTFEELVAERDLTLADIDLGDVTEADLGAAGAQVFAADGPGIVGPVQTDLGPALFRVNAVLAAQETGFDDARSELVDEFALDRARRVIAEQIDAIDDLLAGGATLEELDTETEMQIGRIDWTAGADGGIAGYEAFRVEALAVQPGDFPEVLELDDGGIFALRADEVVAPRREPFEDARPRAEEGWRAAETARMLAGQAGTLADALRGGADPAGEGLTLRTETGMTRARVVDGTPPELLALVFAMDPGDWRVLEGDGAAYILRLDAVGAPDIADPDVAARREALAQRTAAAIGADILDAYAAAVEMRAGISLDQAAINAVHAQFP